jgi:Bacterial toxin 37/Pretoxin HINT domain
MNTYKRSYLFYLLSLFCISQINAHGFAENTLVKSSNQYWWAIEQVTRLSKKEKQYVISYNVAAHSWTHRLVTSGAHSTTNCYVKVGLPKNFIICTPTQEFYLAQNKQWASAYKLQAGDVLLADKNNHVEITSIEFVQKPLDVYSIQVEDTHTFLVSPHSIVTHNMVISAVAAGLSIPFSTGCSGGAMGAAFGPIGFVGGLAVGGIIGCAIKFGMRNKVAEYTLNYDVDKLGSYVQTKKKKEVKTKDKKKESSGCEDAQAPGMPTEEDGFFPKKNWDGKKVRHRRGYGWPDKKGNIWIPTGPRGHGCPHWDVQRPDGTYDNVVPGGKIRGQR